jgi:hypothetical protein
VVIFGGLPRAPFETHRVTFTEEEYAKLSRTILHGIRNGTKITSFHVGLENAAQVLWPTGSVDHIAMRHVGVAAVVRYLTAFESPAPRWEWLSHIVYFLGEKLPWFCFYGVYFLIPKIGKRPELHRPDIGYKAAPPTHPGNIDRLDGGDFRRRKYMLHPPKDTKKEGKDAESSGGSSSDGSNPAAEGSAEPVQPVRVPPSPPPPPRAARCSNAPPPQPPALKPLLELGQALRTAVSDTSSDSSSVVEPTPPTLDTPSTPEDAVNGAEATEDGRTLVRGDVVAVLGQNFNKSAPVDHIPVVGALVGPCQVKPNVYSKTVMNLEAAIEERITKKAKPASLTREEIKRIGKFISTSMSNDPKRGVFSKKNIEDWAIRNFDLAALKSGKWSEKRFASSMANLWEKEHPTYKFKADIKYECMPEGKAPRMLIADGDEGQLMALAVVKCFEDLLFHHFEEKSIKHTDKRTAVQRSMKNLRRKGAKAIEGDGSAWDTTCNKTVRGLIENPVLRHIFNVLAKFGVLPETWMEEHCKACEQNTLRLFFANKFETVCINIDAIRRSGHRGTSCLNWWMNFTMWACAIFKEPERFLDPEIRNGEDLTGKMRWWFGVFEGDDSLCTLYPPMREGDKLSVVFLAFWSSGGFNMKIVFCTTRATFVGWHIGCTDGEINDHCCPELPRALANSGVSVSAGAVEAAKAGNRKVIEVLAAASALARASDFSGILPSVSNKYLEFAESLTNSNFSDREMSIRSFGDEGHGAREVREQIRERNIGVTPQDEMVTLEALCYNATHEEIATFSEYVWSLDPHVLMDYGSFRSSLPPSWRS